MALDNQSERLILEELPNSSLVEREEAANAPPCGRSQQTRWHPSLHRQHNAGERSAREESDQISEADQGRKKKKKHKHKDKKADKEPSEEGVVSPKSIEPKASPIQVESPTPEQEIVESDQPLADLHYRRSPESSRPKWADVLDSEVDEDDSKRERNHSRGRSPIRATRPKKNKGLKRRSWWAANKDRVLRHQR